MAACNRIDPRTTILADILSFIERVLISGALFYSDFAELLPIGE